MTRLWAQGIAIRMELNDGLPGRFVWERRTHPVLYVANHWRVDVAWWRWRVWRDYWKLVTGTGLLVVVYQDLSGGGWYLQRLYD